MGTVEVGVWPIGVALHGNGSRVYVTNSLDNTLSFIDTASNTVVRWVGVGISPGGVAVHPDGKLVYVANTGSNTITLIATAPSFPLGTVAVGRRPFAFGHFIGPGVVPSAAAPQRLQLR